MKKSETKIINATWCPKCGALKGQACQNYRMHQTRATILHDERTARFKRLQKSAA